MRTLAENHQCVFSPPKIDTVLLEIGQQENTPSKDKERSCRLIQRTHDVSTQEVLRPPAWLKMFHTMKNKITHAKTNVFIKRTLNFITITVKHTIGGIAAHQPIDTNFISLRKLLPPHQTRERKGRKGRKGRSCQSEASHYYGNVAHTAQHRTDAGCHGFTVTALAKELLYK